MSHVIEHGSSSLNIEETYPGILNSEIFTIFDFNFICLESKARHLGQQQLRKEIITTDSTQVFLFHKGVENTFPA